MFKRKGRKTRGGQAKQQQEVVAAATDDRIETETPEAVPSSPPALVAAQLRLLDFDCEVEARCAEMKSNLQQITNVMRHKVLLEVQKLPPTVRQCSMDRLINEFGGDITVAMAALARETPAPAPRQIIDYRIAAQLPKTKPVELPLSTLPTLSTNRTLDPKEFVNSIDTMLSEFDPELFGSKAKS